MLASITGIRPTNCDVLVGAKECCPECGMHHLRPGYCAALDSLSDWPNTQLGKAWLAKHLRPDSPVVDVTLSDDVTLKPVTLTLDVTLSRCAECGADFVPERSTARYCSAACRKRASRHQSV